MASTPHVAVDIAIAQANFWASFLGMLLAFMIPRHGPVSVAAQREAVMSMSLPVEFTVH
jgi:hypothetical protein